MEVILIQILFIFFFLNINFYIQHILYEAYLHFNINIFEQI